MKLEEKNGGYIISSKLSHTNNKNLKKQKIYLDKKLNVKKVEVFDESGNIQIKMVYNSYDPKASFNNKYFTVSENMKSQSGENDNSKTTSKLEESVYPMYLPSGTYLSDEESVLKDDGDRIILTFAGESPFIIVEESVNSTDEMETIPVYGEPTILADTVGALSESSVNFISDGVEYYIASDSLTMQEILQVAESINQTPISK